MYDMYTSDLSFWTMVSSSQPGPSCMTCVHQIFPFELWFLGLYLVLHVWHVSIRYQLWFLCLPGPSFMTYVHQIFPSDLWFLCLPGPSCMICVHQIFPSELWFLGLYLVFHVWHVYIRSFLLNYGFMVSKSFFMYDICPSDINYGFFVSLVLHVWHMYIRSFLLNYGFLVSTWFFMYDMCTSDLSFWTMVSWFLPGSSCMTFIHQIFPSELWCLGLNLVLPVWHVYIRSLLLNYGFLVSTWSFMYDMCYIRSFLLNYGFLVSTWSCMYDMCNHIFPSELWFLGLYLVLHVCHVYIRSFLLNYDFLV